jgi:hypothetical protein
MKHLITSGCSYTEYGGCWPYMLKDHYEYKLHNYGKASAGNDWALRSTLYGIHNLLKNNVATDDIIVSVMWTYPNRKSFFVSKAETPEWDLLTNEYNFNEFSIDNPVNFLNLNKLKSGWLVGDANCKTYGELDLYLDEFKENYITKYFTFEGAIIDTLEHILFLQSFCESKKIKLLNQYYANLFYYPDLNIDEMRSNAKRVHITEKFENVLHLYEMINFSNWTSIGLIEYSLEHKLDFTDCCHPAPSAHHLYVNEIVIPKLEEVLNK